MGVILYKFTKRIISESDIPNLKNILFPIPEDIKNPILAAEVFFEDLHTHYEKKRLIILLDEFQKIVHQSTADFLDLFRSLVERGILSLVMFGLSRPGILEKNCKTQFTYAHFPVDFFNQNIIKKNTN